MVAADFTEAEADALRRAMATFKKSGDIARFEEKFVGRMTRKGYPAEFANRCFSQIKGFGTYGFPESHAAAFAHLVYVSAWIKCHHPAVFCAAILNSQPMGFYAPAQLVRDARAHGVEVRPIDVDRSRWDHTLEREGGGPPAVRLGFRLIHGFGQRDAERLIARRGAGYGSLAAVARRSGLPPARLRLLAEADAFAGFGIDRRAALWTLGGLDHETLPLFAAANDGSEGDDGAGALPALPAGQDVAEDYAATGLTLKRHPMSFLRQALAERGFVRAADLAALPSGRRVTLAGLVLFRQRPGTASGTVFMTIEDETGSANLIVWPALIERHRRAVYGARLLAVRGTLQREGAVIHVISADLDDWSAELHRLQAGATAFAPAWRGRRLPAGAGHGSPLRLKSRDFR
jgi:error-prone DNA polymerase